MKQSSRPSVRVAFRLVTAALVAIGLLATGAGNHVSISLRSAPTSAFADSGCSLANGIQHVIYIQFDNVHLRRDNPNVPSDLEQMPHLLNFIENNGVMLTNEHTPLIAHTADDILTSLTGLYPDRHGVPVANSFRYFNPDGTSNPGVSFAYWTDPIYDPSTSTPSDTTYNMLTAPDTNTPAPWVPYTRAGCNVGAVSMANIALENIGTDIPTVFGAHSPQAAEVASNPDQATADFTGLAIHCAQGAGLCSSANGGEPDILPTEPYGYGGFMALFGNKYIQPVISPGGPVNDLNGSLITNATSGLAGFPGFNPTASQSLAYTLDMQEHGVPVTYTYISDAHDNYATGVASGPGQADYVARLKSDDQAFATFFTRLNSDGINSSNSLFVFTADEGDHFVGGAPSPANCDGVTVPCTYSQVGELNGNLAGLLATQQNITTPFKVHSDSAPNFYVTGNPNSVSDTTRDIERAVGKLTAANPITGATDPLTNYMADRAEMSVLHMVTADAARTPTFTLFANPDYYLYAGAANCTSACVQEESGSAWNHGDVAPEINTLWLGMVGPGVKQAGVDSTTWADETDIRPTMMLLTGLKDDYRHDGRVLVEDLNDSVLPTSLLATRDTFVQLAQVYKQLDAAVGQLGLDTLAVSTAAMESDTPGDAAYRRADAWLQSVDERRDSLAIQISNLLEADEFGNAGLDTARAQSLIAQGQSLLTEVHSASTQWTATQ